MSLLSAQGWEAVFEVTVMVDGPNKGKKYPNNLPLVCWQETAEGDVVGMLVDRHTGRLRSAESYGNFIHYMVSPDVPLAVIPGGGYYTVYREDSGELRHWPVLAWVFDNSGDATPIEVDADGWVSPVTGPTKSSNFVGIWHPAWGDEPEGWAAEPIEKS